jgi:hypothetical protein
MMREFKFFQKESNISLLSGIVYGWNAYEQMVMDTYKFCFDNDYTRFIGFRRSFRENHIDKVLTIVNCFRYETYTQIMYEVTGERQWIYSLNIDNDDLITIQRYEHV